MRFSPSDRRTLRRALALIAGLVAAAAPLDRAAAQDAATVIGSEFSVSRNDAGLRLEFADGRSVRVELRNGEALVNGTRVGAAARGGALDRSWRALLTRAMDVSADELPALLTAWDPPAGDVGPRLANALSTALAPADAALQSADAADIAAQATAPAAPAPISDSVSRLVDRIGELERTVAELERTRVQRPQSGREVRRPSPFRYLGEGLAGIFSTFMVYVVLFGIGFLTVFFGGRRYIEGVADTARRAPVRSLLVGMAATFLIVPAFVLGIIALAISIVGIPGLLLWIPGFPLAVALAILLGYIGVAHAAGEAFAERRFYVTDWFQRGNSYYFLMSGLALLLGLFFASQVVHMAGPWLGALKALLIFFATVATVAAATVGFGAVLISRAGTRPADEQPRVPEEPDLFTEGAGV